jgi:hypothetical protein
MYKLLYIDDEKTKQVNADSLKKGNLLSIEPYAPVGLEKTRDLILNYDEEIDGLILDLKLDGNKEAEEHATYTAPSLAQAIRSSFTINETNLEVPIFLLTSQENLEKYYDYDLTSHDLFDYIFYKQKLSEKNNYIKVIVGFINAYKAIVERKFELNQILQIDVQELNSDVFPSVFIEKQFTAYKLSRYIFKNCIVRSGILISEKILAARLGINISKSPGWDALLENLEDAYYKGIFSDVWNRWWSHRLINWWRNVFPESKPLSSLEANKRVEMLINKFHLELIPATPIDKATGERFWTICQVLDSALDIRDGILLDDMDAKPWHDRKYISLEAILERGHIQKGLKIHASEKERVLELKEKYTS